MKFIRVAPTIALSSFCSAILFAVVAYCQDPLESQIQRLREGKTVTINDTEFRKLRAETFDKFLGFAADLYVEHIKWSLVSPEKQGAWPYRSFVVVEPDWVLGIYRKIKEKSNKTSDPLFDYALICPALYLVDEPEVQILLTRLEGRDKFLYRQARANLNTWRTEVATRLRSRR